MSMNDFVSNLELGLIILAVGGGLGAALAYLTSGKPPVGPGTRVWRFPRYRRGPRR